MDTMGALALATETPSIKLLDDKPAGRQEALINPKMFKHIVAQVSRQHRQLHEFCSPGQGVRSRPWGVALVRALWCAPLEYAHLERVCGPDT